MKKITKLSAISLLALTAMGLPLATNAKMVDADYIKELSKVVDGSEVIGYNNVYFFGKYAFVNSLTTADLVKAANTLEGATDAVLYLKDTNNTWKNAVNTSETFKASDLSFNLVKIFNVDSTVATTEATKADVEKENATTLVFEDEAAVVRLSGVRTLPAVESLGAGKIIETAKLNHNNASVTATRGDKKITITENKPLLELESGLKEVYLLVKTNRSFDATKITLKVGTTTYTGAGLTALVNEGKKLGAANNEILVKVNSAAAPTTITLTDATDSTNESVDIYSVTYKGLKTYYSYNAEEAGSVVVTTENVSATQVQLDENLYQVVFYGEKETVPTVVKYSVNGDERAIDANGAYSVITFADVANASTTDATFVGDAADKFAFDQSAVKSVTTVKNNDKTVDYNYLVTVKLGKVLKLIEAGKNLGLKVNLGIDKAELKSAPDTFINKTQNFVEWFNVTGFAKNEETGNMEVPFDKTYQVEIAGTVKETVKVKYLFVDETSELTLSNASMGKATASVYTAADTTTAEEDALRTNNAAFNKNMKLFSTDATIEEVKDAGKKAYKVYVQATKAQASVTGTVVKLNKDDTDGKSYAAMLFDLGIAPANLEVYLDGAAAKYEKVVATDVVSKFGVNGTTGNAIAVLLDVADIKTGKYLTFVNTATNESVKVTLVPKYVGAIVKAQYKTDLGETKFLTNVRVLDTTKANYTLDEENYKSFIINNGTRQFEVTSDEGNFTWFCDYTGDDDTVCDAADSTSWTYKKTLAVKSVSKPVKFAETDEKVIYNNNSVTVKSSTDKVVNVELSRALDSTYEVNSNAGQWYRLVLDLGVLNENITGVKYNGTAVTATKEYVLVDDAAATAYGITKSSTGKYNEVVLWLNAAATEYTDTKEGLKVTFVQKGANKGAAETVITIKSTMAENAANLAVKSVGSVTTTRIDKATVVGDAITTAQAEYQAAYDEYRVAIGTEQENAKRAVLDAKIEALDAAEAIYTNFTLNNKGITASIKDKNNVTVSFDNNLTGRSYVGPLAGGNAGNWYGLLVDLGVNPENISVTADANKYVLQTTNVALYGATGTQFVLWLNGSAAQTVVFNNTTETNKYDKLSVKFTTVNNTTDELKLKSLSLANANIAVGTDADLYKRNQNLVKLGNVETAKNTYSVKYEKTSNVAFAEYDGAKKIALVVDLGINPDYVTVAGAAEVAGDEASLFGLTGTQFLVWVEVADTLTAKSITLTDAYTGVTFTVNLTIA